MVKQRGQIEIRDAMALAVPIRTYANTAEPQSCLTVFAHGGGFTWGTLDDYDQLCCNIVTATNGKLVSVDYRLAPAHPFPAALDDLCSVFIWADANRDGLVAPSAPQIIAGDSAGGCLAAGAAQRLVVGSSSLPDGQLLIYPMIEHYSATPGGFHDLSQEFGPRFDDIKGAWDAYIDPVTGPALPYSVPSRAASLAGLPPTLVITAANDPLRFEGEAYADRLAAEGVPVRKRCHDGVAHSFLGEHPDSPEVGAAIAEIAAWMGELRTVRGR